MNTDSMLTQSDLARAITLASIAHGEQIDKSGKAYILHPLRVMRCDKHGIDAQIVAVLHEWSRTPGWTWTSSGLMVSRIRSSTR